MRDDRVGPLTGCVFGTGTAMGAGTTAGAAGGWKFTMQEGLEGAGAGWILTTVSRLGSLAAPGVGAGVLAAGVLLFAIQLYGLQTCRNDRHGTVLTRIVPIPQKRIAKASVIPIPDRIPKFCIQFPTRVRNEM